MIQTTPQQPSGHKRLDLLHPIRRWLDNMAVTTPTAARRIVQLIPAQCPFERDICILGIHFHIPPLCKLNPLYDELVALRFRAICYLADGCGEDVTRYAR